MRSRSYRRLPTRALACLAAALVLVAAPAQAETGKSELFAREALRICVDTRAEPEAVRALAVAENWTAIDPALVPFKASMVRSGKTRSEDRRYQRAHGWLIEKEGLAITVGLFDIEGEPRLKQCEATALDLDASAVDGVLRSDGRLRGGSPMPGTKSALYTYSGENVRITYLVGDIGDKLLHVFIAN